MLLVYTPTPSVRVDFTLGFVEKALQIPIQVTHQQPASGAAPVLVYASQPNPAFPYISAHELLFSSSAQLPPDATNITWKEGIPCLFSHSGNDLMGFDVFAAIFYMLTRFEEYHPAKLDVHGRFPAHTSLAYRRNFLHLPVVDFWVHMLRKKLLQLFPGLQIPPPHLRILPTMDIDNAWAYRHKPFIRQTAGMAKNALKGQWPQLSQRLKILRGQAPDPYGHYQQMKNIHHKAGMHPVYFFQLSNYGPYDTNLPWRNKAYRQLIKHTKNHAYVGIHPGYRAAKSTQRLITETRRLREITGKPVKRARFHYIRLRFPQSYRMLLQAGIQEDYSMGFPDHYGFRAGTCRPFPFFDLQSNASTQLILYPFALMDATLAYYHQATAEQALKIAGELLAKLKQTGGYFTTLWHNEAFGGINIWQGWPETYKAIIEASLQAKAYQTQ